MSKEINALKRAIGKFFMERRERIGWSQNQLKARTNTSGDQITKLESGTDSVNTGTFFRVMLELGIGMHLTEQNSDEAEPMSMEGVSVPPPFLTCTDGAQLYVLHWQRPAFLIQVMQTIPPSLRFVATYGPTPEQVKELPVWAELQRFVAKQLKSGLAVN